MSDAARPEDIDRLILPTLYRNFDIPSASSFEVRKTSRLYSSIWSIKASYAGRVSGYYVKSGGGKASREFALCARANSLLKDRAGFVPVEIYHDEPNDLLFASELPGVSLEELASKFWSHPWAWYGEMRKVAAAAGAWLRTYHDLDRRKGSIAEQLLHYAERREAALARLEAPVREGLTALIRSVGETDIATLHSDYSPGNIIWNDGKVGVIDYGINEWLHMSPWWDILTFEVILERNLHLSKRTPLFLLPTLRRGILSEFSSAYGGIPERRGSVFLACAAVRHLSLMRVQAPDAGEMDTITAWHARKIENILSEADV